VLKAIVDYCNQEDIRTRVAFIEDYDLLTARHMVQGCDVWLNTPRRGLEASGTSGMKVLPNGGINLSIPDGWWCEGYAPEVGWAIGQGEDYDDHAYQDQVESDSLYNLLEKEVIPLFYERGTDGMPKGWIARMKASMRILTPIFSTNRMLAEYVERYYLPAAGFYARLAADGCARARDLAEWKARLRAAWDEVKVDAVAGDDGNRRIMGDALGLSATVRLGSLRPEDVCVEVCFGHLDARQELVDTRVVPLTAGADLGGGVHRYEGTIPCDSVGQRAYSVRVRPDHPDANNFFSTELMTWQ
jgi:starch phosphorylase